MIYHKDYETQISWNAEQEPKQSIAAQIEQVLLEMDIVQADMKFAHELSLAGAVSENAVAKMCATEHTAYALKCRLGLDQLEEQLNILKAQEE